MQKRWVFTQQVTYSVYHDLDGNKLAWGLAKEVISAQKHPGCKKGCGHPKKEQGKKSCEIKDGSQEMAVMVG